MGASEMVDGSEIMISNLMAQSSKKVYVTFFVRRNINKCIRKYYKGRFLFFIYLATIEFEINYDFFIINVKMV